MFFKIGVLKNFAFIGEHLYWSFFFGKLQALKTLRHVFSCEYCEIFRSNLFYRTALVAASVLSNFWTLDFCRTVFYEITLLCLPIRLSDHPSLNFLKIKSLVFSDILLDDSWTWYLVILMSKVFLTTKNSGN